MKKLRLQKLFFIGWVLVLMSCKTGTKIQLFENYPDRDNTTQTLFDLFYGMNKDSSDNYYDTELDGIDKLLYKEYRAEWKIQKDTDSFIMSIGLYIDKQFPNELISSILLEKVDSVLPTGMKYDLAENELISLKSQGLTIPNSLPLFLDVWNNNFNRLTKVFNGESSQIKFDRIPDSRGCVVCHRIYEDAKWVTYILETSYDYHGSLGCPSAAEYITIDKHTGHILSIDDILKESKLESVYKHLPKVYEKAAKKNGITPPVAFKGEELLREADGVALINEGLLVYYQPYNLGCGVEGQYNLVLPLD